MSVFVTLGQVKSGKFMLVHVSLFWLVEIRSTYVMLGQIMSA
jgi:hypothetical protein